MSGEVLADFISVERAKGCPHDWNPDRQTCSDCLAQRILDSGVLADEQGA